jgi:FixJ family two-component response regulator
LLTGSKEVGDEYVRLCLELVLAEPKRLATTDLRVALFTAFHAVWKVVNPRELDRSEATRFEARLEQGLAALDATERRVLLLAVVEDFALEDVAQILGLDVDAAREHLALARQELNSRVAMPVLIIEDEPMIAMELSHLVEEMGLVAAKVVAREEDALSSVEQDRPGLVLADIQLQDDGSGIVAAHEILQRYDVPIVFVTGFPERLLTGEGLEPAFVVAKPFKGEGLKATIAHALSTYAAPGSATEHRAKLLAKLRQITAAELRGMTAPS